jgi:hypothetical protein
MSTIEHLSTRVGVIELFTETWMQAYMTAWNAEPKIREGFAQVDFSAVIGYGYAEDDQAAGMLVVENGQAVQAGVYDGRVLTWDLRAERETWKQWVTSGVDPVAMGVAYAAKKFVFRKGNYHALLKDIRKVIPFVQSFAVMGRIGLSGASGR